MKIKNDFNNQTETVKRSLGQVSNLKEINRKYGYHVKHGIVADKKTGQFYKQNTFIIDKDKIIAP